METNALIPDILITPVELSGGSVGLTCCPVTLNPLDPDMILTACEYDVADGRLVQTLTARSYGPILFDKDEIVEVHRSVLADFRVKQREIHWVGRCGDTIRLRLRDVAETDVVSLSTVDLVDMEFPVVLAQGLDADRQVRYLQGNSKAIETFHDSVTGQYSVSIASDSCLCLKLTTTREGSSGRRVDTYVDMKSGAVKYIEIFNQETKTAIQIVSINPVE